MKKLQTKCMFASAAVHALLLVALVVGSAFVSPKPKEITLAPFKMFKVTDDETSGGGNPNAVAPQDPPPAPVQPAQTIQAPPPKPEPVVIKQEPVKLPDPPKSEPVKPKVEPVKPKPEPAKPVVVKTEPKKAPVNKNAEVIKPKPEPKKHEVTVDLSNVVKPDLSAERQKAEAQKKRAEEQKRLAAEERKREFQAELDYQRRVADANAKAQQAAREQQASLERTLGNLASKTTGSTLIEMPGPGGEAFINYSELIYKIYYDAWMTPNDRGGSSVRAEIVVSRDGRVIRADIISKSGDAAVDRSVRQTLDRVKSLPGFPPGAKDANRTFKITFSVPAKRQLG